MPEWNPYKPPSADVSAPVPGVAFAVAGVVPPRTGWAKAATVSLALCVLIAVVSLGAGWRYVSALQDVHGSDLEASADLLNATAIVDWVLYLGTGVCFLAWVAGASRTARSIDPSEIRDTPTWAVAWWFIPIANFYKPYASLKKIWQATMRPSRLPEGAGPPAVFPIWWTFFVIRLLLARLTQAMFNTGRVGELIDAAQVQMVYEVVSIVAALAAIGVIRAITEPQLQLARQARAG